MGFFLNIFLILCILESMYSNYTDDMELNKIYNENCLETMSRMPDNFIDLVVTSPPYDDLRTYNGYSFDFENIAKELFRIIKVGGVVVWVVGDKRKNGNRSLTHFKQSLYFQSIGFNVHDIMVWHKTNPMPFLHKDQYVPSFELMIVLSKNKPKTHNLIQEDCKYAGKILKTHTTNPESIRKRNTITPTNDKKIKSNVWDYTVGGFGYNVGHPAPFPEQLANDHIISWSNPGDIVFDPFMGSGTTAKMTLLNERNYIGSEISDEYIKISEKRIKDALLEKASKPKQLF